MLNNADFEFPSIKDENGEEVEITHGRYIRFLESSDPTCTTKKHLKRCMIRMEISKIHLQVH